MRAITAAALIAAAAIISGCQSASTPAAPVAASSGKSAALRAMEPVAIAAYRCWFDSNDPAFRGYSFANELDSHSGRPRFLLVPKSNYGGRPLLVVQAEGPEGRLTTFGPLTEQPLGQRINSDVRRWASGDASCSTSA